LLFGLMIKETMKSRFTGALVGTGVGDSLGAFFEGRFEVILEEIEAIAQSAPVLTYTDDTHMMIGVAESLIRSQGFDGEDMAETFARNYELEPFRGYGPGPPHIFRLVRAGVAWDEAAHRIYRGGSYGNGSAMRIAPVGVLYHDNLEMLREVAYRSSQITHAHNLGKEGAALQAYAIALAANLEPGEDFNRHDFLAKLTDFVAETVYRKKLKIIEGLVEKPDRDRVVRELGHGIEAFNSVPTAIYSFLSQPHSFAQAVFNAISLGGDTDTIGAMTGAISGAYLGVDAVPAEWRDRLENRWYIEELGEKLWHIGSS
jgi:poly(ADP-ribose) glycohydrolase ARH3